MLMQKPVAVESYLIIQLDSRACGPVDGPQGVKDAWQHGTGCTLAPGCLGITAEQHLPLCLLLL